MGTRGWARAESKACWVTGRKLPCTAGVAQESLGWQGLDDCLVVHRVLAYACPENAALQDVEINREGEGPGLCLVWLIRAFISERLPSCMPYWAIPVCFCTCYSFCPFLWLNYLFKPGLGITPGQLFLIAFCSILCWVSWSFTLSTHLFLYSGSLFTGCWYLWIRR